MKSKPSYLMDKVEEILMKRYAVEKIIGWKKLFCVSLCSIISFLIFQVTWILCSDVSNLYVKFFILMVAVISLSLCWGFAWKSIGKIIPKFVLIGMLGWIFIISNITPSLIIGDKWGLKENFIPEKSEQQTKNNAQHMKGKALKNGEDSQDKAPRQHSTSWPISRLLNLNEKETEIIGTKPTIPEYLKSFLFPILILKDKQTHPNKQQILNVTNCSEYNAYIYVHIGLCLVVGILLFLNISTYRKSGTTPENSCLFYLINHHQREENTKNYLILLCVSLIGIAYFSLNYFLFFWVVTFIATIFLFRWEIEERGKNHKKLSRSVLFVILAQVFSSITGEILFLILLPLYTDIGKDYKLFNLYDSVVLGWLIFLGSAVTVLIGIVTQVIWSGKRMTDRLRN
jgi:hypothetical protein